MIVVSLCSQWLVLCHYKIWHGDIMLPILYTDLDQIYFIYLFTFGIVIMPSLIALLCKPSFTNHLLNKGDLGSLPVNIFGGLGCKWRIIEQVVVTFGDVQYMTAEPNANSALF